ncbi:hypothetical protein ABEB36_000088 [Hypothenemus hampei]|uniref:Anoctamin n=1 Tax=Hypothenemus hampei TaxID=57062 RepID=A0ABD1FA77_HYPHA
MSVHPTFKDGKRLIDFILVYKLSALVTEELETKFKRFISTIEILGLEYESESFTADEDVIFIKIHAPVKVILIYAEIFDIGLAYKNFEFRPYRKKPGTWFATPLTRPNIYDPIYTRAPEAFSGDIPNYIITSERIMVVNQILRRVVWGDRQSEYGLHRLIKYKILTDAFPLHDGNYQWTTTGPLNDRQLLAMYWGSFSCWHKKQPLNLIDKYFGTEYALYFAWVGMYIKYLIPAAVLSTLVLLYGFFTMYTDLNYQSHAICKTRIVMCPRCHFKQCPVEALSNSCYMANINYIFDNWCAVIFSAIMSLWATVFMELWQREESILEFQWNLKNVKHSLILRPEFIEVAKHKKYCPITDKMHPYIPKIKITTRYVVTIASLALLLFIVILATFGVMVYHVAVHEAMAKSYSFPIVTDRYRNMIGSFSGAILTGIFIFIFKAIYGKVAILLNDMENHRTQHSYNSAFIYKCYALAFANNYSAAFYIAFFKGKFYSYPGDLEQFNYLGGIQTDICDPTGCLIDLAILLIIIMIFRAIGSNFSQLFKPKLKKRMLQKTYKINDLNAIPQWENEYLLPKSEDFFMIEEYTDMVIQYGFVNFFIMGFPLAPILALLNNISELRVDALKVTKNFRRPIPVKVAGLGAWFAILQATTYIGVVTNALVIAFTSGFMEKVLYSNLYSKRDSYFNVTLSIE